MRKKAVAAVPQFEMRHRMQLALEYAGVSVNEMAAELDASRTTVSNYLHGRTKPKRPHLIVWAMRCGVPFEWLVNGESVPNGDTKEAAPTGRKAATR
jgi:transcriptional regulator with XRE-family HTH domain